jgi:hypothetical protein
MYRAKCIHDFGGGNLKERDDLHYADLDGRIILKQIFKKLNGRAWTELKRYDSGHGQGEGSYKDTTMELTVL